ncbi:MAG: hypothetical protein ACE5HT_13620 [Gemmatimonadales bacterium]
MSQRDRDIHEDGLAHSFHCLRNEVSVRTPRFAKLLESPHAVTRQRSLAWAAIVLVAIAGGTTLWLARADSYPTIPDSYNVAAWRAPSDFLIHSRSREMLSEVPTVGRLSIPLYRPNDSGVQTNRDTATQRRM